MQTNKTKLQEWLNHFNERKQWKGIIEISSTSWVYVNPKSIEIMSFIQRNITKLKLEDFNSFEQFSKRSRLRLNLKEWRNANSDIPKACAFYVKLRLMEKNPISSDLDLQEYLMEANMWKNTDQLRNRNKKDLKKGLIRNDLSGIKKARLHKLELSDVRNKEIRKRILNLDDYDKGVELYYHENKLKILCEKASRSSFKHSEKLSGTEVRWLEMIPESILNLPQIIIYSLCFRMISQNCEESYFKLKDKLSQYLSEEIFSNTYLQTPFEYLMVFCIRKINNEAYQFANEYLEIFDKTLEHGISYVQGKLPSWRFKNVLKAASKNIFFENTDKNSVILDMEVFLNKHQNKLVEENKDATIEYCKAFIEYLKGNYEKAERLLIRIQLHKDEIIRIESLFLYLFVLLENDNADQYLRNRDNLREMLYTKRGIISNDYIEKRNKAISYLNKVQKIPILERGEKYLELLNDINTSKNFMGKDWLIDFLKRKIGR